jgi:hypothetical protein
MIGQRKIGLRGPAVEIERRASCRGRRHAQAQVIEDASPRRHCGRSCSFLAYFSLGREIHHRVRPQEQCARIALQLRGQRSNEGGGLGDQDFLMLTLSAFAKTVQT